MSSRVLVALCGPAAESIFTGQRLLALFDGACRSDWERARAALRGYPLGYLSF